MVEDAGGDAVAADARDVNTQLQAEMIKQRRKTNALLRARAQTVSASLAPARTRTRLVQQQQHHALRWQPSEERDPADHRAQPGKVKYAETGFSDTVPTRLTKCGRLDSNWHWNPCSYPFSPESLPRLDLSTTRRPCSGRLSFGEKSSRSFKVERLGGAHAHRTQLQQLKYVTMRTHRLLCVSSSAERALAQPPKYMGRKYDLYHHHSHPSQKCKYHNP